MYLVQFNRPQVIVHSDPIQFGIRVRPFLVYREAENNYLLSHFAEITSGDTGYKLFTVEESTQIVAGGVLFPNGTLCMTWASHDAIHAIAEHAVASQWLLRHIYAPSHVAWWLADAFAKKTGQTAEFGRTERIYQLATVHHPLPSHGHLEVATPADRPLVKQWLEGFIADAAFEMENKDVNRLLDSLLEPRHIYFWKSPQPVAMAAWVGPTPHGASLNFVYTPPELRGQGYGKSVSAALVGQMLASGLRYCFILADAQDARTNAVYQSIGGRTVCELMRTAIVPAPQSSPAPSRAGTMTA